MLLITVSFFIPLVLTVLSLTGTSQSLTSYWLSYWVSYSILCTLELNSPFKSILPYYAQLILYLWLLSPYYQGCRVLVAHLITHDELILSFLGKLDPYASNVFTLVSSGLKFIGNALKSGQLDHWIANLDSLVESQKTQQITGFYALKLLALFNRASTNSLEIYRSRSSWIVGFLPQKSPVQSNPTTPTGTPTKRSVSETIPKISSIENIHSKFRKSSSTSMHF
ncbi:unnamed protein product [Kuraishia capsulata CBS 1993]|uniref:Protein YOP1 n=1 Tax=Kuraishia capsulata CBS 1993 TaxID=1382522 RepID=W6MS00_9ASCO|nr:uncharacterized protein KUCA_T00005477001 [Kuraishia capsulata CBS 1993]CDK29489.1 unnamed protein product [Kuraishia capsulata CBS 1993]